MIETCGNCGARLAGPPTPAPQGGFDRVCTFCGARNHTPFAAPPPPPWAVQGSAPPQWPVPPPLPPHPPLPPRFTSGSSGRPAARIGILSSVFVVGLIFVVNVLQHRARQSIAGAIGGSVPGMPVVDTSDGPAWDEVGGSPAIASVGGADAIVGRLRAVGKDDALFVGAFDATSLKSRWTLGPFGTYSQGYRATRFAVAGGRVVVTDFHSTAHVYTLDTGAEERTVHLTDKVEDVCAVPPKQVWLNQVDKRSLLLDVTTGALVEAKQPAGCMTDWERQTHYGTTSKDIPEIPGFAPIRDLPADSALVVYGKKTPGTATPMLAGVDPRTHAVRWRMPIPVVDLATARDVSSNDDKNVAVHGDRAVVAYGVGDKAWHVTSIDVRSGTRQWDVVLRPIFAVDWLHGITVSNRRVFVVRMMSVDVLDADTGQAVGTIGRETYESSMRR